MTSSYSSSSSGASGAAANKVETASALLVQAIESLNKSVSVTTNATLVDELVQLLKKTIQVRHTHEFVYECILLHMANQNRCLLMFL